MAAARYYAVQYNEPDRIRVACLNFASPRRPGGSFREGTSAQEESLARSSTLIMSLESATARQYYEERMRDGLHSHSMLYSPGVAFIKDDDGNPIPPYMVNIVTSAAVNAGEYLYKRGASREVQKEIEREMEERMARILQLCELRRDRVLVLGCFGTGMSPRAILTIRLIDDTDAAGVFQNSVSMVARIWARLLGPGGFFSRSFQIVEFAILGERTFQEFNDEFGRAVGGRSRSPAR